MAAPVEDNYTLDPEETITCEFEYLEDDEVTPIDVSAWTFRFTLTDANSVAQWDITNTGFTRPASNKVQFTKTAAQVTALAAGLYTMSFRASKGTEFVSDEYAYGVWQR